MGNLREPPCDDCYVELAFANTETQWLYSIVCNQVRLAPSGEVIGLDYKAVIEVLKLYTDDVRGMLEWMIEWYKAESEYR